jgi:hypothetical protein
MVDEHDLFKGDCEPFERPEIVAVVLAYGLISCAVSVARVDPRQDEFRHRPPQADTWDPFAFRAVTAGSTGNGYDPFAGSDDGWKPW